MPGRTSTRSARPSTAVSHKSSMATLNSRASMASRASSATLDVPPDAPDSALRTHVVAVFREAQRNTASHRKLAVTLRKLQETCCYEPEPPANNAKKPSAAALSGFREDDFNAEFARCVLRVMPVRKTEAVGDKTVRFVGLFLRFAIEKDNELLGEVDEDASTMPETPATRLTTRLMETVLPLLAAKDKFVRYRATQLMSHIVNSLDAIDDDLFRKLRSGLLRRVRDKEPMVRAQAVLGLGRLAGNAVDDADRHPDASDDDDDTTAAAAHYDDDHHNDVSTSGLLDKLLEVLQNDASPDVRRSLLVNLPILPRTLPYLLERARDDDAATRRAVYSRLLPALGDFRHLSLSMREKLLRWGLRDRDENVRKAAGRLFCERWIEDCVGVPEQQQQQETVLGDDGQPLPPVQLAGPAPPDFDALLELLERIDVVNSGVEDGVALEAMSGFWDGRPDYRDAVVFDDAFWETLSAESVFIARTFNDYCRGAAGGRLEALVEEKLPEVTRLAFYLERYVKVLIDAVRRAEQRRRDKDDGHDDGNSDSDEDDDDDDDEEEDTVEQEFIVEQLLHIALTLDYSDEVGRRKMFSLLRQSLSIPELPDEVTKLTLDVLRDICAPDAAGEREFCSVVLEAVADVHDTILDDDDDDDDDDGNTETMDTASGSNDNDDDSFHSARSEISRDDTPTGRRTKTGGGGGGPGSRSSDGSKKKKSAAAAGSGNQKLQPPSEKEARYKAVKEIVINMKCLHIVQCMLANVAGSLQENDHLVSMLNNLVVPAVRSHEAPVRERGLVCLGLCSLLDRSLAEENLALFVHFFTKGHAALQITALHILTDILNVHGAQLLSATPALLRVYVKALRSGAKAAPEVQAAAVVAVSKLLLGRVVTDADAAAELLRTLVVVHFEPASAANHAVRQALNYFLPVFCFSRPENQHLMRRVALDALHALFNVREGLLDDDDADVDHDMVALATIAACLVDWTDPRKCYSPGLAADATPEKKHVNGDVHLDFARDILNRLEGNTNKEEKKIMAPLLGKLYVSPASSEDKIRALYVDVSDVVDGQLLSDATGRNALYKMHVALGKIVNNLDLAAAGGGPQSHDGLFRRSVSSRATSVALDDRTVTAEDRTVLPDDRTVADIKEEDDEDDDAGPASGETTVIHHDDGDSLVDDLLTDGEA